jgi:hypothetical protein
MMSNYPLSRCPFCRKAFRMEINCPTTLSSTLGLMACPHCGLNFQRFDPNYLNAPRSPLSPRSFSNFG